MKQKNLIAFVLTGLFLVNLFVANSGNLLGLLSGEKITVVNPFCKKSKTSNTDGTATLIEYASVQALEIPVICTTAIDFKNASFSLILAEDNFKNYIFNDELYSELFSKRFYIPPRV